jgi:hypothetical protein
LIYVVSIAAILSIVTAVWGDLSSSITPEDERRFPVFSVRAMTSLFYRDASVIFEDFSQASASPARYRWFTASG